MNLPAKLSLFLCLSVGNSALADWKSDYRLERGYSLEIDSEGYNLPSAIAFVPSPGNDPKDPLYFVTELRGKIKVVTNDRSVYTFAEDFFNTEIEAELPDIRGEVGLAGIVLDPPSGYVFVSYGYLDKDGLCRNGVSRFSTTPGTFSLEPSSHISLTPVFKLHLGQVSHQIGPMAILDEKLFVCVGDAEMASNSRDLDSPMGKVLRINFDGSVPADNPHRVDDDPLKARNLVWASGLRNPFSIKQAGTRLYVGENGPSVDRLIEVRKGIDYLYDGTNESSSSNSLFVWQKAVSPVQMDFSPSLAAAANFPPELQNSLFITLSGGPTHPPGPGGHGQKSIVAIGIDQETGLLSHIPKMIYAYDGDGSQLPVGLAWGPDGLYIVNLLPDNEGKSRVLKLTYGSGKDFPKTLSVDTKDLLGQYACYGCHNIDNKGHAYVAPPILRKGFKDRILNRLNSEEYKEQVKEVEALSMLPFSEYKAERKEVLEAEGYQKALAWTTYRIMEPRFDQKQISMPNQGISFRDARQIAEWLLIEDQVAKVSLKDKVVGLMPNPSRKWMVVFFGLGGICGTIAALSITWFLRRR